MVAQIFFNFFFTFHWQIKCCSNIQIESQFLSDANFDYFWEQPESYLGNYPSNFLRQFFFWSAMTRKFSPKIQTRCLRKFLFSVWISSARELLHLMYVLVAIGWLTIFTAEPNRYVEKKTIWLIVRQSCCYMIHAWLSKWAGLQGAHWLESRSSFGLLAGRLSPLPLPLHLLAHSVLQRTGVMGVCLYHMGCARLTRLCWQMVRLYWHWSECQCADLAFQEQFAVVCFNVVAKRWAGLLLHEVPAEAERSSLKVYY